MLLLLTTLAQAAQPVVVEVDRGPLDAAPMMVLRGGGQQLDRGCSDDGQGRDRVRNDGIHTCAGDAPGYPLEIVVRWGSGEASHPIAQEGSGDLTLRLGPDGFEPLDLSRVRQPPPQPNAGAPDPMSQPGTTQIGWAVVIGLLALGAAAFTLWPRRLPGGLTWDPPTDEDTLPLTLSEAHARFSASGPVLVVGDGPIDGPALRAESRDVQDLLDTLRKMARAQPLQGRTVLVDGELSNTGDIGLSARERLVRDAPPGTRIVWIAPQ